MNLNRFGAADADAVVGTLACVVTDLVAGCAAGFAAGWAAGLVAAVLGDLVVGVMTADAAHVDVESRWRSGVWLRVVHYIWGRATRQGTSASVL